MDPHDERDRWTDWDLIVAILDGDSAAEPVAIRRLNLIGIYITNRLVAKGMAQSQADEASALIHLAVMIRAKHKVVKNKEPEHKSGWLRRLSEKEMKKWIKRYGEPLLNRALAKQFEAGSAASHISPEQEAQVIESALILLKPDEAAILTSVLIDGASEELLDRSAREFYTSSLIRLLEIIDTHYPSYGIRFGLPGE